MQQTLHPGSQPNHRDEAPLVSESHWLLFLTGWLGSSKIGFTLILVFSSLPLLPNTPGADGVLNYDVAETNYSILLSTDRGAFV